MWWAADLLVGLVSVTTDLAWHITERQWYAGNVLCKLVRYAQVGTCSDIPPFLALIPEFHV